MSELKYIQEREKRAVRSTLTGISLTVSLHAVLLVIFFNTGFTYLDPPPPEKEQILIEFEEPILEKPKKIWNGTQPKVAEPKPAPVVEPEPEEDMDDDDENVEMEVTPRIAPSRPEPQPQRARRTEVVYDNQRVSATSKMRPDDYVKGLRYGKGRKIVSGHESAMSRRSNKSDLIMKIAIGAALIAIAALAYGMWNDWRASRFDAEIYGEVPESAESTVRNPDLDYITK